MRSFSIGQPMIFENPIKIDTSLLFKTGVGFAAGYGVSGLTEDLTKDVFNSTTTRALAIGIGFFQIIDGLKKVEPFLTAIGAGLIIGALIEQ